MKASLRAAGRAEKEIKVWAVEKNPNAIVTLLNLKSDEWGNKVTVISSDMRDWKGDGEKADILVSELLGSFGDNELSPECLDGAQHLLKGNQPNQPGQSPPPLKNCLTEENNPSSSL